MSNITQALRRGFTIVELAIVIVVIGILAAITVVTYSGIQGRGYDVSVQNDLRNFGQLMEISAARNAQGKYPYGNDTTSNSGYNYSSLNFTVNRNAYAIQPTTTANLLICRNAGDTAYAALATSKSGKRFYILSEGEVKEYTGSVSWANTDWAAHCGSVNTLALSAGGAGYNGGTWRVWANSN